MSPSVISIALLGAESTGKTQLATALATALTARGHRATVVPEWLREWCDREGRTPRPDEQLDIALTQARRVREAIEALSTGGSPDQKAYVIADTTPMMTALYSDWLFQDKTLYPMAQAHQKAFDHTLVTGLDLPWVADGLQRDGAHVREPIDALLREQLASGGVGFKVVYGAGESRLDSALQAIGIKTTAAAATESKGAKRWGWACEKCSDPECEHRLFSRLTAKK